MASGAGRGASLAIAATTMMTLGWGMLMTPTINNDHTQHLVGTIMVLSSAIIFYLRQFIVNGDIVKETTDKINEKREQDGIKTKDRQ